MDLVDRSTIASLHAAARRHRSVYVSCLLDNLAARVAGWFAVRHPRTAHCA